MTFDEVLSHFQVKKKYRDRAQCICPAHSDKEASLTISKGDKGTVIHCHAGCETETILGAVGLRLTDLFEEPLRSPDEKWRKYVESREKRQIEAVYEYVDLSGRYAFTRLRLSGKKFLYGIMEGERFQYGLRGKSRKDIPAVYCNGLSKLKRAVEDGARVFYCEGEKDVNTVNSRGLIGVTCGASGDWNTKCSEIFRGADVVVLADNDKPGEASARAIEKDLREVAKSVKVVIPTPDIPKGDVSDFFQSHTVEELNELVERAVEDDLPEDELDLDQFHLFGENRKITGVFDFAVFEHIKKREHIFVLGGVPYIYMGGIYRPDRSGAHLKTMIRELIYPRYVKSTTIKRIYDLFVSDAELQAEPGDMNQYPSEWICFLNGFYDPIGRRMIPHSPRYKAVNQIPHEFEPGKHVSGNHIKSWLSFIAPERDDREMLLQFAGYSMTRDVRQQKFLILLGEGGSGKSTVIKLIEAVIGEENLSNVSLAQLGQRFASYGLMGKLLNSCADLEVTALEDTSTLKILLGEDRLSAEAKGKDAVSFKSYAKLIFSTNELPIVKAERTNGFYRRLLILEMNRIPDGKRADFFEELTGELDFFIHEAVDALERMYQAGTITESSGSIEAVKRLRKDSDTVEAWIDEECTTEHGARTDRGSLFTSYESYCSRSDRTALSRNNFFRALRTKGFGEIKSSGTRCFQGILLGKTALETAPDWSPVVDDSELPFE